MAAISGWFGVSTLDTYTTTDEPDHDHAKRTIAETLQAEARGREAAISSADLAERTPVSASTVRDLVAEVRREYRLPIASADGYFLATTDDEAADFIERQKRQAEQSLRTAREFAANWNAGER